MNEDITVQGIRLRIYHSRPYGNRPTLIFLHDSLGCIELWRRFPDELGAATGCNALVYDRQGYGQSEPFGSGDRGLDYLEVEADVLNVLMEQLRIQDAILFGHSDGGSIALIAAAKYPARIRGLITEGAHIFVEDITLQGIREAVAEYHATNLKERLERYHGAKTDAVFWAWVKTWLKGEFRSWSIEHFLPHVACPALIIQGGEDEFGSLEQVEGIIRQVAGVARQLVLPSVGHSPHKEAREVVLEHAAAFINAIAAERK